MTAFTLPKWYDLHAHFRQGEAMRAYLQAHLDMGCVGILAMPNTKPPVAVLSKEDERDTYWSIARYVDMLHSAGADQFEDVIVPLYLTKETSADMIRKGAEAGVLRACKYYPPHGTTGAEYGIPIEAYIDHGVFAAMEEAGVILCVHGEAHHLPAGQYFDRGINAEGLFYKEQMPRVREKFPALKIVCEHVTTKVAVDFVHDSDAHIAATITPQHLLYTIGDLIQGLKYHLFCLPVLKYCEDRDALRQAVTDPKNTAFFAGTDSAPHSTKMTECGCAAGCFTGGIAPQLYAQGFEEAGLDMAEQDAQDIFKRFLCSNGPTFYDLPVSQETFTLVKKETLVERCGGATPLPLGLGQKTVPWGLA